MTGVHFQTSPGAEMVLILPEWSAYDLAKKKSQSAATMHPQLADCGMEVAVLTC